MNAPISTLKTLTAIVGSAVTVGILDAAWLTLRYDYHNDLFYKIQKTDLTPRIVPAVLIYILIPVAVYLYAVRQAYTLKDAALRGAVVGFILYAFYDLTNYATLINYTLEMTLTDIAWGTTVCTAGAAAGYMFYSR
jgi:uncharacterized membrane protein